MNEIELAAHLDTTAEFIAADPTTLDVWRPAVAVSDGAGGARKGNPTKVVTAGTFRLLPQQDKVPVTQTFNGSIPQPDLVILGMPTFRFQRGDYFDWQGWRWRVTEGHDKPAYESKGDCVRDSEI